MKHVWAFALVLLLAFGSGIFAYLRAKAATPAVQWVAGTTQLRAMRSFRDAKRRTRTTAWMGATLLVTLTVSLAISAGLPVERKVEHPMLASRDIVLCLDASGSMLPYDGQILRAFSEMTDSFEGERISLQLWSAQTITKFPLTDDYELAQDVLEEAAKVIDEGYYGPDGEYVLVSYELADYLEGVEAPDGEMISSLAGDGLATCVLGFDHLDDARSRMILFFFFNDTATTEIYTTAEAVEFATSMGAEVVALYPTDGGAVSAEGEQLRNLVEAAGGYFYDASDPASVEKIIEAIEAQQLADLEGAPTTVEVDHPRAALLWASFAALGLIMLAAVRKL